MDYRTIELVSALPFGQDLIRESLLRIKTLRKQLWEQDRDELSTDIRCGDILRAEFLEQCDLWKMESYQDDQTGQEIFTTKGGADWLGYHWFHYSPLSYHRVGISVCAVGDPRSLTFRMLVSRDVTTEYKGERECRRMEDAFYEGIGKYRESGRGHWTNRPDYDEDGGPMWDERWCHYNEMQELVWPTNRKILLALAKAAAEPLDVQKIKVSPYLLEDPQKYLAVDPDVYTVTLTSLDELV